MVDVLGSKKQVLLVGNDGIHLYVVAGKRVSLYADFTDAKNLSAELKSAFQANKLPLVILFDVVEQQYRKETMPKVNFMDKKKVIQRKLLMAFPQQEMRAFMPLESTRSDDGMVALFAALSPNLMITQVMDAVISSDISILGAALLPLESTRLVKKLVEEAHKTGQTRTPNTRWSILMTHHKTGGLRQVVIKGNELALTRLTPLAINPQNTAALVDEMAHELSATLTYLSRFGYVPNDGLDLIVVSSEEICQTLANQQLPVSNLYAFSLFEACQMAGFTPVLSGETGVFADILHAGWVGLQRKLLMPLSAPMLDKVKNARQSAQGLIFFLILGIAYLGWQCYTVQNAITDANKEIVDLKSRHVNLQAQHDEQAKKLNTLKYDPEKTKVVLGVYNDLQKNDITPEALIALISSAVNHDVMQIKSVHIEPYTPDLTADVASVVAPTPEANGTSPVKKKVKVTIALDFADTITIEDAAHRTSDLYQALKTRLPQWSIGISEMVGGMSIDKAVQGVSEISQGKVEGNLVKEQTSTLILKGELP